MSQKILYVFAHPDDETFTCGGTIAHYAEQPDVKQVLYCATLGDAGKVGEPPVCTREQLGEVRQQELINASNILGIDQLIIRDFGDGTLDQKVEFLTEDVRKVIESERPDWVITFPPNGISGHRDHKAIQQATREAVEQISFPIKLYYIIIPESIAKKHYSHPVYTNPDEDLSYIRDVTPYLDQIRDALLAHKTQHLSVKRVFPGVFEGESKNIRSLECFQLVIQK